jgi:3-(3-hydroxy-phenyl)propionate hydroxylase
MFVQMPDTHIEKLRARVCDRLRRSTQHDPSRTGMPFEGSVDRGELLVADVPLRWEGPDDEWNFWLHEDGLFGLFPMGGGRYRVVASAPRMPLRIRALLQEVFSSAAVPKRPKSESRQRGVVPDLAPPGGFLSAWTRVRGGRRRPCTESGGKSGNEHRHPGCLQSGWKIGMHRRGNAPDSLLASYGAEREPVGPGGAQHDRQHGRDCGAAASHFTRDSESSAPRPGRVRSARTPAGEPLAEISVNYRGSPIVGQFGRWYAAGPGPATARST